MTITILLLIIATTAYLVGIPTGWGLNNIRQARFRQWARLDAEKKAADEAQSTDLYKLMRGFSIELEQSVRDLYEHPKKCKCAYCQIKYGRNVLPSGGFEDGMDVYHPEYVRALHAKNKGLQTEVKDLRAELERRDRQNAEAYQQLPQPRPGETYAIENNDGSVTVVGREMADLQAQKPMVAETATMRKYDPELLDR